MAHSETGLDVIHVLFWQRIWLQSAHILKLQET